MPDSDPDRHDAEGEHEAVPEFIERKSRQFSALPLILAGGACLALLAFIILMGS